MEPFILVIIIVLLYFLWPFYSRLTTQKGAPFVPTEPKTVEKMLRLAQVKKGDVLYDLGSGDGRIVTAAALMGANAYGVEIDPLKTFYSHFMLLLFGLNKYAKIIRGDFYKVDLSKANVVTLFLLPETNQKLKDKLQKELRTGSRIVSYAFKFDGWKPSKKLFNQDSAFGPIYLYIR